MNANKRSRARCCALLVLLLVLGVASTVASTFAAPTVTCKSTIPCKSGDRSQCIENGQLVGCIVTCCQRNKVEGNCTSNFYEYGKYAKMIESSKTFQLNNSNLITTNDYCDCDEPSYVSKARTQNELCSGNVKVAGNVEKRGNATLQQIFIWSGVVNYFLVICSLGVYQSCGPLNSNTSRVFRSWKEQKGIDAEYEFSSGNKNHCFPLCAINNYVRFHVPIYK